jgi:uncharacterized protein (DUF2164 family)
VKLTKEQKLDLIREVQQYFRDEFDTELGDLRAEFVLEFFEKLLGPPIYNEAIADARAIATARSQTIDEELFALTRQPEPPKR